MTPLALLMLILGFAPNPFLERTEPATQFLLDTIEAKRIAVVEEASRPVPAFESTPADDEAAMAASSRRAFTVLPFAPGN